LRRFVKGLTKGHEKKNFNNYCLAAKITPYPGYYCEIFSVYGDLGMIYILKCKKKPPQSCDGFFC
jgi:hypothetical protein